MGSGEKLRRSRTVEPREEVGPPHVDDLRFLHQ